MSLGSMSAIQAARDSKTYSSINAAYKCMTALCHSRCNFDKLVSTASNIFGFAVLHYTAIMCCFDHERSSVIP